MTNLQALVVEDSPDDAELLLMALARAGYVVSSERVQTGPDMEAALASREWDIIFSDWGMPQFSALDALEIAKRLEPDVPFIIVSGTIGEDIAVEALRGGAQDFFVKDKLTLLGPAVERGLRDAEARRDRMQMREQLFVADRMATVGILAAGVAHEINNPLASLIGNLDLLRRRFEQLDGAQLDGTALAELREELRDAHEAAGRIRNVANDLKLFARVDSEERVAVDIRRVIESSLRMAHTEIRHRARLRTDFAPVPSVAGNESRLGQVFLNLILNAAQAIPEGHAEDNEISIVTSLAPGGHVTVEVRDTGSGMSAEVKRNLFTPLFTTKPIGVGTGLGLSICHRIVTSLGGTIAAESEVGRGSVFRVRLVAAAGTDGGARTPEGAALAPRRRGTVLVIDDEPMVGTLAYKVLRDDHDVTRTTSAREALEWIGQGLRYDVILCDLMMPQLTGMDFHAELVRVAPEQALRVIFLTGGAFTSQARQFLEAVSNLCIEKPFDIHALSVIVNSCV